MDHDTDPRGGVPRDYLHWICVVRDDARTHKQDFPLKRGFLHFLLAAKINLLFIDLSPLFHHFHHVRRYQELVLG